MVHPIVDSLLMEGWNFHKEITPALRTDDQFMFTFCVKHSLAIERYFRLRRFTTFCPLNLLYLICIYRAGNCARAFVRGHAGVIPGNLNNIDRFVHLPPLHHAAQNLSFGLTEAFLMAGADPNLCCRRAPDYNDLDNIANLPLSLALEALSSNPCVTDWSVDKSVVKLIYIFCLEELKDPLETIRILASRTQLLEKLSLQFAEKGQVVQLTALLLVAWHNLVTPYFEEQQECLVEHCPIGQCIMKQLQSLPSNNQQMTTPQCTSDLAAKLESAWKMLKLLESHHQDIDAYLVNRPLKKVENHEVPFSVLLCTDIGGPEDLRCDDIQCLKPGLKPKQKAWLDRALQTYSGPPAVYLLGSKKGFAATYLSSKSFHTCSNQSFTNDKGRLTLTTTKVEKPAAFRQLLPTARTCAYLVSMAKRRLK